MNVLLKEIRHQPLLWLLVFVPIVFIVEHLRPTSHTLLFVLSVLAIVPLAALLSHATESVAAKTGDAVGGLLDIHDRRPVVLRAELVREWLDPATPVERAEQMLLFEGEGSEVFEWYNVGNAVGIARNQGANLINELA
mgnify:CR=1 FL=1